MKNKSALAYQDLVQSLKKYRLWLYFGWADIKLRYKGSVLGPFWITLSNLIFVIALGLIYSHLLHVPLNQYIPYLTSGFLIWNYIATALIDSNEAFHNAKPFICHIKLPYLLFIYRVIWRNILIFLHNLVVYLGVAIYFHLPINNNIFYFLPGFALLTLNLTIVALLIGLIATRYRDIPPVINSAIQIIFFVSPIAWMTDALEVKSLLIQLNPVTYFLDLTRSPLLGQHPHSISWLVCISSFIVLFIIVSPLFAINRTRIPFWL